MYSEKVSDTVPRNETQQGESGDGMNDLLSKGKGGVENVFTYDEKEQKLNDKIVKEKQLVPQFFRKPFERKECGENFSFRLDNGKLPLLPTLDHVTPFSCTEWDLNSNFKVNLNKHNDFHTGKKPYVIDSSTKPKANFRRDGNMLKCENCDEIFTNKSTLDVHESGCKVRHYALEYHLDNLSNPSNNQPKMQANEKPYACSNCDFKSPNRDAMKKHMNSHMEKNIYMCICNRL